MTWKGCCTGTTGRRPARGRHTAAAPAAGGPVQASGVCGLVGFFCLLRFPNDLVCAGKASRPERRAARDGSPNKRTRRTSFHRPPRSLVLLWQAAGCNARASARSAKALRARPRATSRIGQGPPGVPGLGGTTGQATENERKRRPSPSFLSLPDNRRAPRCFAVRPYGPSLQPSCHPPALVWSHHHRVH